MHQLALVCTLGSIFTSEYLLIGHNFIFELTWFSSWNFQLDFALVGLLISFSFVYDLFCTIRLSMHTYLLCPRSSESHPILFAQLRWIRGKRLLLVFYVLVDRLFGFWSLPLFAPDDNIIIMPFQNVFIMMIWMIFLFE